MTQDAFVGKYAPKHTQLNWQHKCHCTQVMKLMLNFTWLWRSDMTTLCILPLKAVLFHVWLFTVKVPSVLSLAFSVIDIPCDLEIL